MKKKIWFDDYRFSEDMDFTFQSSGWDRSRIEAEFISICEWVFEESRIKLILKPEESTDSQYRCYIIYSGPLGGEKNIKCDISKDELNYFGSVNKPILDSYSDTDATHKINCYSLEEVLAEKLRCVMQRTIPRDIYDIWYLTEKDGIDIEDVAFGFEGKTTYKELNPLKISCKQN